MTWLTLSAVVLAAGCSNKPKDKEAECVTPPKGEKIVAERTVISAPDRKDWDWCRACVVGPHGFMSCQRVTADSPNESRGAIRERARAKACEDSGFTKETCPDEKVIAIACKGDEPPKDKTAAGKAMLKALKTSGPLVLTSDPKDPSKKVITVPKDKQGNTQKPEEPAKTPTPKSDDNIPIANPI
jgi:hypothetical protein